MDIGCGAGRHSLYLQKKGLDVLGIDVSPLAIRVSKLRGVKRVKILAIEQIGRLKSIKFGTVLMLGNNFGLFCNSKKAHRLLKILHQLTTARGVIIASTLDPYKTNSTDHLDYHKRNRQLGRLGGQVKLRSRHGKLIGPWFDYLFVSLSELKQLIDGTGWVVKNFFEQKQSPVYTFILEKF